MSDAEVIELKREEEERLDTAEEPNDEVRYYHSRFRQGNIASRFVDASTTMHIMGGMNMR